VKEREKKIIVGAPLCHEGKQQATHLDERGTMVWL